jgi:lipopolysaccharide heptosyltransferase II
MRQRATSADHSVSKLPRSSTTPVSLQVAWSSIRRLLAIRLDNIGDMVMLSPSLRTLRHALPEAELHLMASPAGSQVAGLLPWIDDVFVHRAVWQELSGSQMLDIASQLALIESLRLGQYDAAVVFTSFRQSPYPPAYACYLAGIPLRLGQSREFGGTVLSHWIEPLADETHQVDRNLHLLEAAGLPAVGRKLELHVPDDARQQVDDLFRERGISATDPFVALAPGASCASRRYAPSRFADVARELVRETGMRIVVVGSAKETDLLQPLLEIQSPAIVPLIGRTTVPMLAEVVRRARLVVANNSAAMHLADAFERPAVILYSGTDREQQWRPRRAPSRLLHRPTVCSPCYAFTCPYHTECLDVPPAAVVEAAVELLGESVGKTISHQTESLSIGE